MLIWHGLASNYSLLLIYLPDGLQKLSWVDVVLVVFAWVVDLVGCGQPFLISVFNW